MGHAKAGAKRVLICGGGVIGASIAYFLGCRGIHAIVIERSGLACAASGKSGGFLALDWCDGSQAPALRPGGLQACACCYRNVGVGATNAASHARQRLGGSTSVTGHGGEPAQLQAERAQALARLLVVGLRVGPRLA